MGLFDKLFAKKNCDICGDEIGLLGNRKLEDGNLCKACAAKLSPFFEDRRSSTVEEIRQQLAYREANRAKVADFTPTKVVEGDRYTLYFDEDKAQWLASDRSSWRESNPDVIDFAQVTGAEIEIDESKEELTYENKDGEQVSYKPPRYRYTYDFSLVVHVNSPYFNRLSFALNKDEVENRNSLAYRQELKRAEEAKAIFTGAKERQKQAEQAAAEAAAPKAPVVCPGCGATTVPGADGCCEYCGRPV